MRSLLLIVLGLFIQISTYAQSNNYNWAFGFYGDMQVSTGANKGFGMQAKYDLDGHNSFQGQIFGRTNNVNIGADYLYGFLDAKKSDFNVFLGVGVQQDFYWTTEDDGILRPEAEADDFCGTAQAGLSYYFRPVRLSVFSSYKVKYKLSAGELNPNFVTLGFRYHLW